MCPIMHANAIIHKLFVCDTKYPSTLHYVCTIQDLASNCDAVNMFQSKIYLLVTISEHSPYQITKSTDNIIAVSARMIRICHK